ncbi:MAG: pyridoxamine 5'-phosphate oxidase family protein [Planctomycetota bacterium]|jgi:hypothetical protein
MDMQEYFEQTDGLGILATADSEGNVDVAIYARPHVLDEATVAFIMREHLSLKNLQSNPKAAYMFVEKGQGYSGKRLYLTKTREEADPDLIDRLRRRPRGSYANDDKSMAHLVTFSVDRIRPLVGDSKK